MHTLAVLALPCKLMVLLGTFHMILGHLKLARYRLGRSLLRYIS